MPELVPYYSITSCCDQSTTQGFFTIPGSTVVVTDGVYTFTGITFLEGSSGMWFYSGFCYTIQYAGTTLGSYPPAFNYLDVFPAAGDTCLSSDCTECGTRILPSYSVYNCCDAAVIVNLNIDLTGCLGIVDGVWVYDGNGYSTDSGFQFIRGECYNFNTIEDGSYENGPPCYEFTVYDSTCQEQQDAGKCPACDLGLQYLKFQSCCSENYILFRGSDVASYYGVREYLGPLVNGLENICYSITIGTVGDLFVPDVPAFNALPFPPAYIEGVTFSVLSNEDTDCTLFDGQCPSCFPLQCYTLYNCDGESFNTTIDLSGYLNSFIAIIDALGVPSGPWFVVENNDTCDGAIDTFTVNPDTPEPCIPMCYNIEGTGTVTYIGYDLELTRDYLPIKICSYIYPEVTGTFTITEYGECTFNETGLECPELCFLLTNCEDPLITYNSNSQNLLNNVGEVVTIAGYDGCWEVSINDGICDCPINVIVLTSSVDCETCETLIAYKLTNCDNPFSIQYTYDDLSQYVGQTVLTDCGCFIVELINFAPPAIQPIVIITAFDNCVDCKRPYYKLLDCNTPKEIYTFSDLSQYVGTVVKIANCDECWTVSETDVPIDPGIVTVISSHTSCISCVTTAPCICSNVRNDNAIAYTYDYIDCYGETQSVTVQPGETSPKICLIKWLEPEGCECIIKTVTIGSSVTTSVLNASGTLINFKNSWDAFPGGSLYIYYDGTQWIMNNSAENPAYYLPPSKSDCPAGTWKPFSSIPEVTPTTISTVSCQGFYQYFGDCTNGVCPAPIYHLRTVKPGYNTPACSAEKYERISCKAAQILYRNVLTLRYGISNCCPEDDEYWLIKKELIDLAALYNPDYPCAPNNPCGCGCGSQGSSGSSCGCGQPDDCSCNQLRSCNS
jgi:hypothetical protein